MVFVCDDVCVAQVKSLSLSYLLLIDLAKVGEFKLHVEERYGIAAMDQVWLVKDRDQPLQDDESVCDCISAGSEVQLLVELNVNKKVLQLLPKLQANDAIPCIYMRSEGLRDVDAEKLAEALKANTALTKVYLDHNNIGDMGCTALAEALKVNTAVMRLYLSKNNIGDAGCGIWLKP